jgi:hypothetical protein
MPGTPREGVEPKPVVRQPTDSGGLPDFINTGQPGTPARQPTGCRPALREHLYGVSLGTLPEPASFPRQH